MPSAWLALAAETDPLARARSLQRSWERLLGEGGLGPELPPEATAGLRPTILDSWRRSVATGLDPTGVAAPIVTDRSEVRERWLEHPLAPLAHVLTAQLRPFAEDTHSLLVVTDAAGLLLHLDGAEWLQERAREMNFSEGGRFSEDADGTNGIGTALAADQATQVFAFEHFNELHHQWTCSGAPVHDPVSGAVLGLVDLTSLWKLAHPRSLELVTTTARTLERCLLARRRDQEARLRRRYSDLMTRSTDLLVDREGYVLDGDERRRAPPLDVPEGGGELVLGDGSPAVAEPLGQDEAYLVRRRGPHGTRVAPVDALERAEARARELAAEQAALRKVASLVARESSPDRLFAILAEQAARIFDVQLVRLVRFEPDGSVVMSRFGDGSENLFPVGSQWPHDTRSVVASVRETGRPARVQGHVAEPLQAPPVLRLSGMRSAVACPILVEGRLWGAMVIASERPELPEDTEAGLSDFTELVATAIANVEARAALARIAEEQAALRRVATLVAHGVGPDELFAAVTNEVGRLLGTEAAVARFEPDGSAMIVLGLTEGIPVLTIGTRWELKDYLASTAVYRTGRPARNDHTGHRDASGEVADSLRRMDFVSTVAAPIVVEDGLWGVLTVSDKRKPLPPDAEERVERFTELVGTAIANAESREELAASEARIQRLADEQSALRRVATLVAEGAEAEAVFSAVALEVQDALDIPGVTICRREPNGFQVIASRGMPGFPPGSRWPWDVPSLPAAISETGRPARIDDFTDAVGLNAAARDAGVKAAAGVPIVVGGSVWGSICAATTRDEPLPPDTEERLGHFRDLIATSISNAIMRAELAVSRARIIAATDDARRRIERDLHDGAQQRLVTLTVALRRAEAKIPAGHDDLRGEVTRVAEGLTTAVDELRELSRGIHPSILTEGGLSPALKALGRRSPVRVKLDVGFENRLPDHVEVAAYYTVSEALTNTSKHANATRVWVSLRVEDDVLRLSIRDDGVGGADASRGSGLTGLRDRIEALGGNIEIVSPPEGGTSIQARIPIHQAIDLHADAKQRSSPVLMSAPSA